MAVTNLRTGSGVRGCADPVPGAVAPRALITGITGQDGSYLAEQLAGDGVEVVGVLDAEVPVDH